ncbi:extracellular lipase [Periconia macrospinosa]|uniref:Carboxylic ester hydrolase n=1 Tax=Periconia macrospinosa TaxID=97972 RepID=A0A2V1D4D4_9PLEO|nr:extracellular lipase [Periconia macrospinosa]
MKLTTPLLLSLPPVTALSPAPSKRQIFGKSPTVTIQNPSATIIGSSDSFLGITPAKIESFKGIPFAQPPVGALRLKAPQPLSTPLGTVQATNSLPPGCPQFIPNIEVPGLPTVTKLVLDSPLFKNGAVEGQEDCLTINVQRPAGTTSDSKLPVLFWIFGGGFELGSTLMYDGAGLLSNAIAMGRPFVFVAVNYRVGGFGFLGGKEILKDGSANLGLLDQRAGLEWVADNIAQFGGDPKKITIWGESSGAISVFDQLALFDGNITYKGKPLFRGAIMDSGTAIPVDPVDTAKAQEVYDAVVKSAGCAGDADTLACLRGVSFDTFLNATRSVPSLLSFNSVALSYLPRPDGKVLTQSPEVFASSGKFPKIPFIVGDQEDEGTLFALFQSNLTTTADIENYLSTLYFRDASPEQIKALVATYPDDAAAGSPFGSGQDNNWYPQFKRLAAILGDATFTLTRRFILNATATVNPDVPSWSYLASYGRGTPILGTLHGSDLLQVFYGIPDNFARKSIQQHYFNFLYNLDPNNDAGGTAATEQRVNLTNWTPWKQDEMLMNFLDDSEGLIKDDFRQQSFQFLADNSQSLRF